MGRIRISRFEAWMQVAAADRPAVYRTVYGDAALQRATYWLEILLSAGIATLGLVLNSPAVVIGAMLISPLIAPIMATGLGLAAGDLYMVAKALAKLLLSILLALGLSAALVWLLPFHSPTAQILSRTNPTLLDLGIALLSGLAGSVAVSRSRSSEGMTTVPGVAIAVALMPPLCTAGFGVGSGLHGDIIRGAALLFLTNIVAIVFSAFVMFLLTGFRAAGLHAQIERARAGESMAEWLERGPLGGAMRAGGRLRWRALVLVVLLGAIAWPLQAALRQVTREAKAREAVQAVLGRLIPASRLVSEQTEVGRDSVVVRAVVTGRLPAAEITDAEGQIARRSGLQARLSVASVASQTELAELTERLDERPAAPAPAPVAAAPPPSFDRSSDAALQQVGAALGSVWPRQVPMEGYSLDLSGDQPTVRVMYQSHGPLDPIALELITRELRAKLAAPGLMIVANRAPELHRRDHRRPGLTE